LIPKKVKNPSWNKGFGCANRQEPLARSDKKIHTPLFLKTIPKGVGIRAFLLKFSMSRAEIITKNHLGLTEELVEIEKIIGGN